MSTFRTYPKAIFADVSNVSVVRAGQWNAEGLDGFLTFLAASRHLQMPQHIGRPLEGGYTFGDGVGQAHISLRTPPFSSHITTQILSVTPASSATLPAAAWPGAGMIQELNDGGGGWIGNISFIPSPLNEDNSGILHASWTATDAMSLDTSPDDYNGFPLPIVYDDQEDNDLVIRIDTPDETTIYAVYFQSSFLDGSTLVT